MIASLLKSPVLIILTFGTLGIASLIGVYFVWKKEKNTLESLGYIFVVIGFLGFFLPIYKYTPIPGFRLIFSSTYIFLSIIAFQSIIQIYKMFGKKIFAIILIIYFIPNIITFTNTALIESKLLKEPFYHLAYLPKTLYDALLFLRTQEPKNAVVMGNPVTSTDMLIPGFTGKRTYSGHHLMTLNSEARDKNVTDFLYAWTDQNQAKKFLVDNNIKFVMWTTYSGDVNQIKRDYKFLKVVYENPDVSIFTYN
jgi:hypothetical protein